MLIKVNPHKIEILKQDFINEKEINISECIFLFADEINDNFVKEAYFTLNEKTYKQIINNNKCNIPSEVLIEKGTVEIGVVAYYIDDNTNEIRYNPSPVFVSTIDGSLKENVENSRPITPSEFEQYQQLLKESLEQVDEELQKVIEISQNVDKNSEYAKEQGDYAKEQGEKAEEIVNNIDNKLADNLKNAKDYANNLTIKDIKEIKYDEETATFTFIRHDKTELVIDLPIEQLLKNGFYDENAKELVLVLENEQEIRIPATGLIDDYSTEDSDTIQLLLSAKNVFKAILKSQSVKKTHLSTELQEEIDSKLNENSLDELKKELELKLDSIYDSIGIIDSMLDDINGEVI